MTDEIEVGEIETSEDGAEEVLPSGYDVSVIATMQAVIDRFRVATSALVYGLPEQPPSPEREEMLAWARIVAWNDRTEDEVARAAARLARGSLVFQTAAAEGIPAAELPLEAFQGVLLQLFAIYRGDPSWADMIRPGRG